MKEMFDKIKNDQKLKASLFFGFYFFFFLFIAIIIRNNNVQVDDKNQVVNEIEETIVDDKSYSINYLENNNYKYHFVINDNNEELTFDGTKDNIDYNEFENKYFLDIYNVNQIIKNSKFLEVKDNILSYEVSNFIISSFINGEVLEGTSTIDVYKNDNGNLIKVIMDFKSYFNKDNYLITLNYEVGDTNEQNNPS